MIKTQTEFDTIILYIKKYGTPFSILLNFHTCIKFCLLYK